MILITSANGNQGKVLIPKLLKAGHRVRACVRSAESARYLREQGVHEVLVGDLADAAFVADAVRGVASLYHIGPTLHHAERAMGFAMVDAARAAGVGHFVLSSVLHAITTDLIQHEIKRDLEEHLLSSGLAFTILQPANYMLPHRLTSVFQEDVFRLSWALERRQSMVDLDDVTDVVAGVFAQPELHCAATYELVAPGRFTGHDIGRVLSEVLGRDIRVERMDSETFIRARMGDCDPSALEYQLRMIRAIEARYSSHDFLGNPNVLTWLLGRPPTSFEAFVRKQIAILNSSFGRAGE
jgi:uncharacterized protein YbjT (DUF2867 family)